MADLSVILFYFVGGVCGDLCSLLFQLYGPVSVVEELFPASVAVVAEVDVHEGIVPGFDGLFDEGHVGLFGGSSAFFDIALCAGADYVLPDSLAAHAPWDDVVEGEFAGREAFAAILAPVFVAGEDVSPVKFDFVTGQTVVKEQSNNAWHGDIEVYSRDPVVPGGLKCVS